MVAWLLLLPLLLLPRARWPRVIATSSSCGIRGSGTLSSSVQKHGEFNFGKGRDGRDGKTNERMGLPFLISSFLSSSFVTTRICLWRWSPFIRASCISSSLSFNRLSRICFSSPAMTGSNCGGGGSGGREAGTGTGTRAAGSTGAGTREGTGAGTREGTGTGAGAGMLLRMFPPTCPTLPGFPA
jgi:hypothetical protein